MKFLTLLFFYLSFCSIISCSQESEKKALISSAIRFDTSSNETPTQLINNLHRYIELVENAKVTNLKTASMLERLYSKVNLYLYNEKKGNRWHYSAEERQTMCKKLIGIMDYKKLEDYFMSRLASGDSKELAVVLTFLGKGLTSFQSIPRIQKILNSSLADLSDDIAENNPDVRILFNAAEALCYLGLDDGVVVLESALSSAESPKTLKRRALESSAILEDKAIAKNFAKNHLESKDALVAYVAFDVLESISTDEENLLLTKPALQQLEYLDSILINTGSINYNQQVLLGSNSSPN